MASQGVVAAQDHAVVEMLVDPGLDAVSHVAEVGDHAHVVEGVRGEADFDAPVVPVGLVALALVVDESVAEAEVDVFDDFVHDSAGPSCQETVRPPSTGMTAPVTKSVASTR